MAENAYAPSRDDLWRLPEVMRRTGLGETEIYARMKLGTFPHPKQLGPRAVAWPAGRVLDWIAALPDWHPTGKPAAPRKSKAA